MNIILRYYKLAILAIVLALDIACGFGFDIEVALMAKQITSSSLVITLDYNTCLLPFLFIHMPNRLKDSKIINIKPA